MVSNPMMIMIMADLVLAGVIVVDLVLAMAMMFYSSGRHLAENVCRESCQTCVAACGTHTHAHARARARTRGRKEDTNTRARARARVCAWSHA